ncbi:hypothetical protein MMC18_007167 [Xylographa bjoerkii]|nr:hypothetical protein [Xylographa bjoerkii]
MAGIASSIYNTIFRRNQAFLAVVFGGAFAFELGFDRTIDKIWDTTNKGVQSFWHRNGVSDWLTLGISVNGRTSDTSMLRVKTEDTGGVLENQRRLIRCEFLPIKIAGEKCAKSENARGPEKLSVASEAGALWTG